MTKETLRKLTFSEDQKREVVEKIKVFMLKMLLLKCEIFNLVRG